MRIFKYISREIMASVKKCGAFIKISTKKKGHDGGGLRA
jgi:hypothetical protein